MISIVAVISKNKRAIGYKNKLLWNITDDLFRLKKITTGHPVIMGRLTYESIGRPLRGRTNIVVMRSNTIPETQDLVVVGSIEEAMKIAGKIDSDEIFIIGGGKIYAETIGIADRLYLTIVDDEPDADTFFPDYSEFKKIISEESHPEHKPPFTYLTLER